MTEPNATPEASLEPRVLVPKKKVVDIDAMKYAQDQLDKEYLALAKRKGILLTEVDKLEADRVSLLKAVQEVRSDVQKVNDAKKAAVKSKEVDLEVITKKVSDQSNELKAAKKTADEELNKAQKEEKKAYEKVVDIDKTLSDLQSTRTKVRKESAKLKTEIKSVADRSKDLKIAETNMKKCEVAVLSAETTAANNTIKLEKRDRAVTAREEAVKILAKETEEKLSSVNTRLKGIDGAVEKAQKEIDRAHRYYTLIDEAKREILTASYTEDDIAYKNLSVDQAEKVDHIVGSYLEKLASVYEKKDS
jgi:chromosome segregation ATPase